MEGAISGRGGALMEAVTDLAPGKGHRDENFPVASLLLKREYRAPVMAFYRFARAADDVADNPEAAPRDKLRRLAAMRDGLDGAGDSAEAIARSEEHTSELQSL